MLIGKAVKEMVTGVPRTGVMFIGVIIPGKMR